MIVEMGKNYQTTGGNNFRLITNDAGGGTPVVGMVETKPGVWKAHNWRIDGSFFGPNSPSCYDLVEVKPRINGTYWLCISKTMPSSSFSSEWFAKECARDFGYDAVVRVDVDCEEGHGL